MEQDTGLANPVSIQVEGLTRTFGDLVAVDHLDFEIPAGQMTGFVGANGAGKTTTMRMIVGVLSPTSGRVSWSGQPITAAHRCAIGYMPEERGLYPKQPVIDQLVYLARIKGESAQAARIERQIVIVERGAAQIRGHAFGEEAQAVEAGGGGVCDPVERIRHPGRAAGRPPPTARRRHGASATRRR